MVVTNGLFQQGKSSKIKPAIAQSIGFTVVLLSLLLCGFFKCGSTVVVEIYELLVLYSLFKKLKLERRSKTRTYNFVDPMDSTSPQNTAAVANITIENHIVAERPNAQEASSAPMRYSMLNEHLEALK